LAIESIRPARASDLEALTALYNHYIATSPATFDIDPKSLENRAEWLSHYGATGRHRLLVAESEDALVGYAATSRFRDKAAYDTSVEMTIYLSPDRTGRGVGRRLYEALFEAVSGEDVHRAYAGITMPNPASEALHRAFGFEPAGCHHEVGRKFGKYWSVQWLEKRIR
jgi:phosphinothricin acetyltransferase